jgi:SAM-dependent methyltransferase
MPLIAPEARDRLLDHLVEMYRPNFRRVAASEAHFQRMARDSIDENRSLEHLAAVEAAAGPLAGRRTLEVGSGPGLTVAAARLVKGAEAYGVEPGDDEYGGTLDFSWRLLDLLGVPRTAIVRGTGEAIPFPDGHFDVVYSSNVLEHVDDPPRVIAEMVRVLKPGGYGHIVVPNYGSWWEGHYGLVWLPHSPAWLGKLYVGALGRDASFIDTLQLVTRGKLERWIAPLMDRIEVRGWGVDVWESRVRGLQFSEFSALGRLKSLLRVVHALRVVPVLIALGKMLHWETPLILSFRRRDVPAAQE